MEQKKILIKGGYVIDPRSGLDSHYDILIAGDRIAKIGKNIQKPEGRTKVIDAQGMFLVPGFVDVHVHFREPGFTQKEDIITGAKAAARGGYTTVVMMANTKPAIDNEETLSYVLNRGKETGIHVKSCANVTMGLKGEELTPMEELAGKGAAGFTDDGIPILREELVKSAMEKAAGLNLPISLHEEDPRLIENNGINRGKASAFFGIGGSPREAEIRLVERDLQLAIETGACVNIQHISTKEAVELVRQAKKKSANIHAEATPHHFTLTEEAVLEYGTLAKMNPPLREEADRQAIIEGLKDGTIDIIATDHAPHTKEEKAKPITEAPSGIIGLETAFSLGITSLVLKGHLSLKQLIEKMSCNPASMYHLDAGYLAEGGPADITLLDGGGAVVYRKYASKAKNTPFTGRELVGKVLMTICSGKVVYSRRVRVNPKVQ